MAETAPVAAPLAGPLVQVLDRCARPTLVLHDPALVVEHPEVTARAFDAPVTPPETGPWGSVVLIASDAAALRRWAAPEAGRTRAVLLWLEEGPPVHPEIRPEWPGLAECDARREPDGAALTRVRFSGPAFVHEVVGGLVRDAGVPGVPPGLSAAEGLVVAASFDADARVPADVLIGAGADPVPEHQVTGRAAIVDDGGIGPVDEGIFNPTGFRRDATGPVLDLDLDLDRDLDRAGPLTPARVASLRDRLAVRVTPASSPYDVAALAMAGVPLLGTAPAELGLTLPDPGDLGDPLAREEHSIVVRRTALARHSSLAWRTRLAARAGVRTPGLPSTSVLLATRRPELLAFALTQIAKQRDHGGLEVVLAAHGFAPDPGVLASFDLPVTLLEVPADVLFGDALDRAAAAASGDVVLKMDDDDWYGPDVVRDLLDARRYAGADLVGMPPEQVYLEPLDLTLRRRWPTECHASIVAGGTMMIARGHLREMGGFRSVTRSVDAQLLAAVRRAGGRIYRAQGLGYLVRRTSGGHTWNPDLGYFLRHGSVLSQWRGFRPSRLLTYDESERPGVER